MKNLKLGLSIIILISSFLIGCKNDKRIESLTKTSESELTAIITKQVDSLYSVYERFDYDWIEFYADSYTAIYPDSPIQHLTKDSLKAQWERIYSKYDVKLVYRGRPTIIPSEDMAISYNSFNEIFINKENSDTIKNVGTYIANWKKQSDDSWKIVFETLQNH
ncbi:YybH family protein [Mariniflexile sp. HNIBRBA6329]|uniref:YybH family protein n=1 Tax=Mariniflexile sp. HNIBRBA6329 TaxID=3373088 RepID=UPI003744BFD9